MIILQFEYIFWNETFQAPPEIPPDAILMHNPLGPCHFIYPMRNTNNAMQKMCHEYVMKRRRVKEELGLDHKVNTQHKQPKLLQEYVLYAHKVINHFLQQCASVDEILQIINSPDWSKFPYEWTNRAELYAMFNFIPTGSTSAPYILEFAKVYVRPVFESEEHEKMYYLTL